MAGLLKSGVLLAAGNITGAVFQLARNVLIARLVSVEDYGIAATFGIAMAVVEMVSALALDRLIVQAKDGEDPRFQAVLQSLQLIRGAVMAMLLLLCAPLIAWAFGVPEIAWAYQVLALVPLVRGAVHFDIFRAERASRFWPRVRAETVPLGVSTALAGGLGFWLGDWRAMLWALVAQHALYAAVSFWRTERGYRLAWNGATAGRALRFGWPLLVNGALMFLIFQGDRVIVGNRLGLEALGLFGAAFTLTLMASTVLAKTLQSIALPRLAPLWPDRARFDPAAQAVLEAGLLTGAAIAVGSAVVGPPIFLLLFGGKYAAALPLVVWLGLMQGMRVAKAGPSIVAMAAGETTNAMIANIVRVAALPVVFWALSTGAGLLTVAWIALGAEALAFAVALWRLSIRPGVALRPLARPLAATGLLFAAIGTAAAVAPPGGPALADTLHWSQLALALLFLVHLWVGLPTLRGITLGWRRQRI